LNGAPGRGALPAHRAPRLAALLRAGEPVERILAEDQPGLARWREERRAALLYPED
jgi:hypothetical protein